MENKENVYINIDDIKMTNQVDDFLSCAEIFSVTENKNEIIIYQNIPKILKSKPPSTKSLLMTTESFRT